MMILPKYLLINSNYTEEKWASVYSFQSLDGGLSPLYSSCNNLSARNSEVHWNMADSGGKQADSINHATGKISTFTRY